MCGSQQPENGADSQTAETATASSDRLHSAGVAPDGVAAETVAHTTTSADNEPATEAGRRLLEWVAFVEKVDDPAGNTIYDEIRRNFLPAIEAEAAERASGELEVERLHRWLGGGCSPHRLGCGPVPMTHPCSEFCIDPAHDAEYTAAERSDDTQGRASGGRWVPEGEACCGPAAQIIHVQSQGGTIHLGLGERCEDNVAAERSDDTQGRASGGLDVERLAEALAWESDPKPEDEPSLWSMMGDVMREHYRKRARRILARRATPQPGEDR